MRGSIRQLPDKRWEIRWYEADGRRPKRTFQRKLEAERALTDALSRVQRGGEPEAPRRTPTLRAFHPEWAAATEPSVEPRSWEAYDLHWRAHIDPMLGDQPLSRFDVRRVQRFIDDLGGKGLAPKYVRSIHGTLGLMLGMASSYGYCKPLPSAKRERAKLPKPVKRRLVIPTVDQVEAIAQQIDPQLATLVLLCGYMGLRQGEALALHPSDINPLRRYIHVHSKLPKDRGERVEGTKSEFGRRKVTMPDRVRRELEAHMAARPCTEWVFHRDGQPIRATWLHKRWTAAKRSAGVTGVRFHDLRHCAASLMIRAGWSAKRCQVELGHHEPGFTLRTYAHLWDDEMETGRQQLDATIAELAGTPAPDEAAEAL